MNKQIKINRSYKIEKDLYLKIKKTFDKNNMKMGTYIRNCLIEFYEKERSEDE